MQAATVFENNTMEYDAEFARSFMERTLTLATDYEGPLDATLLINCLLGLLIVPNEKLLIGKIPMADFESIADWGISPKSIKSFGKCDQGHEHQPTLKQLVRRLRNAVAHFRIDPVHQDGKVTAFSFRDRNGFHAVVPLEELKEFVVRLSKHLHENA